jgi:hypothetical protein
MLFRETVAAYCENHMEQTDIYIYIYELSSLRANDWFISEIPLYWMEINAI